MPVNAYQRTLLDALNIRKVFNGQHVYGGTVPWEERGRRLRKAKAAKQARRAHRRAK